MFDILVRDLKKFLKRKINDYKIESWFLLLPSDEYLIVKDLQIPSNSQFTLIDYLIISKYGLFVIVFEKTKGKIEGSENSHSWYSHFSNRKMELYNPIRKNKILIYSLNEILKNKFPYLNIRISPIVIFPEQTRLSQVQSQTPVISGKLLTKYLLKEKKEVLTSRDMWFIYDFLKKIND